jgi:hypothetical protein
MPTSPYLQFTLCRRFFHLLQIVSNELDWKTDTDLSKQTSNLGRRKRVSILKILCVHFFNKRRHHLNPDLKLDGTPIPVVKETKFLGIIFDSKLSFIPHLKYLNDKCLNAMNLLRMISSTDWGADSATLLKLYRSIIRWKLDYGCTVYGSARKSHLNALDRVLNRALRIWLGAFRMSPIASLHAEAGEMPLNLRREELTLHYVLRIESNPSNPTYDCIFKPTLKSTFYDKPSVISPLSHRIQTHLNNTKINLNTTATFTFPYAPHGICKQLTSSTC